MNRRDFLKAVLASSGAISLWPAGCARQAAAPKETSLVKTEGVLVNDVHTGLNPTIVDRIVYPASPEAIAEAIIGAGKDDKIISTAGARHAMGGQQFAARGILIDTTALGRVLNFNAEEGTVEVEAGIQWPLLVGYLLSAQKDKANQWGIAQKQTADWLSIGGCLGSNIHSQALQMKPFVQDVESFVLIDAEGKERRCSRTENQELFRLVIGGYGLFGIIYSVTLRLVPRRKVERVAEIISVDELMEAYDRRIAEGYTFGTFLYSANPKSGDFIRKGILVCYRPVDSSEPLPDYKEQPSNEQWLNMRYLAHADKEQYFQNLTNHFLSTSGEVFWSDTHQMGLYVKGYHQQLDQMLGTAEASDISSEVYVPREDHSEFLDEVREELLNSKADLIFGDIGVLPADDESFLAYAKKPYARFSFHIHTVHNQEGIERSGDTFRRVIDMAITRGGSYYLTNHRFATLDQFKRCYPQFDEFIRLKKKHDPEERFQSDWYRRYRESTEEV